VKQISAQRGRGGPSFEVIFVDGGSKDGTVAEILSHAGKFGGDLVLLEKGQGPGGYGIDIRRGLTEARGNAVAWTHADLQCELADVFRAYECLRTAETGKLVVKGSRRGRPLFDRSFTFGMQILNFVMTGKHIPDINGQPKLFPRELLDELPLGAAPTDFSFDLFLLNTAVAKGYGILEVPVEMKARLHGEAKGGGSTLSSKLRLSRQAASYIVSAKRRKP
jgi:glycosyltransferase involved in cell wall biosynthesis